MEFCTHIPFELSPVTVIVGHYGTGKTTFALNVALDAASAGADVTLIDLDVVNPYFRSSEYASLLKGAGIELISPVFAFAGSSLDVPSLSSAVVPAIQETWRTCGQSTAVADTHSSASAFRLPKKLVIIDAGGDDVGSKTLGRFAEEISRGNYAMFYVVNAFRNLTQTAEEACKVMREIEASSHLQVTGIVSNAHLKDETDTSVIARGVRFAQSVAEIVSLPISCVTVPAETLELSFDDVQDSQEAQNLQAHTDRVCFYALASVVRTPWEEEEVFNERTRKWRE